eukprot:m.228213 g.228213  ORF g.228213 m.228213 type:complete len:1005 (+) comp33539_c0_seq1:52-3066(+)
MVDHKHTRMLCGDFLFRALCICVCVDVVHSQCDLAGRWQWAPEPSLDIEIVMTGNTTFTVVLHPDSAWHNASGTLDVWWNGTGSVVMIAPTGLNMSGFTYDACRVITANGQKPWMKLPLPPPTPTLPPTPPPTALPGVDVVWDTPSDDVLGSMPLGNGKLGLNIWADASSNIGLLLSHVDALDENTNLNKLGRIILKVVPPKRAPVLILPDHNADHNEQDLDPLTKPKMIGAPTLSGNYNVHPGFVGAQPPMQTMSCSRDPKTCPTFAAQQCDSIPFCVGYALSPEFYNGQEIQFFESSFSNAQPNPPWTLWQKPSAGPPPPPPAFTQPFRVEYRLHNMSVRIYLPVEQNVTVDVWVDATTDAVRVVSTAPVQHKLEAMLEVWRNTTGPYPFELEVFCSNVTRHPDTVLSNSDGIFFFHRNLEEHCSLWEPSLQMQMMGPTAAKVLVNPVINNTFGGLLSSHGMVQTAPMQMTSSTASSTQSMSIAGTADVYDNVAPFFADLVSAVAEPPNPTSHTDVWEQFWSNSDITITPSKAPANTDVAAQASLVTLLDKVNRAAFYSMALGKHAIKFNAYGIFSTYSSPMEDYRVWGACQWFQNIRLPYYHMLHDGQYDAMKSLFGFYFSILEVSKARTQAWFNISGTYFPETVQQNGLYADNSMGWGCKSADPKRPLPSNTYIRYHREGGLELALLAIDWLDHTGDVEYFQSTLLPQIELYVDYYDQHFPTTSDGILDIFPAQALETWQCTSVPPVRSDCATNPMPEVAGLTAVLPRLLALDSTSGVTPAMKLKWSTLMTRVPPLPVADCNLSSTHVAGVCLRPAASLPSHTSNSENPELYAVHPYRVVGLFANRTLGNASFVARRFHGDTGWSEDLMDAALLGLANESARGAIARASVKPYTGLRWIGFQAGIGAGGPITDHGGVATAGLRYMLLQTRVADESGLANNKIVLFPAWPCHDWAVNFKLHAPGNTTVEGFYDGAGGLTNFSVTPAHRKQDVVFADCVANT